MKVAELYRIRAAEQARIRHRLLGACFRMACAGDVIRAEALNALVYGTAERPIPAGADHALSEEELRELSPYLTEEAGQG